MLHGNIVIRTATVDDAAAILEIYRPYVENTAITFEYNVPSINEMKKRIITTLEKYPYLVAEKDGDILGYAYAGAFKTRDAYAWSCESSLYVRMAERGKGIGKMLYTELENRLNNMGIRNVCACIAYASEKDEYLDNSSLSFHEHMGYTLCAHFHACANKFGRWYDMVWVEKFLSSHEENPDMPTFNN